MIPTTRGETGGGFINRHLSPIHYRGTEASFNINQVVENPVFVESVNNAIDNATIIDSIVNSPEFIEIVNNASSFEVNDDFIQTLLTNVGFSDALNSLIGSQTNNISVEALLNGLPTYPDDLTALDDGLFAGKWYIVPNENPIGEFASLRKLPVQ